MENIVTEDSNKLHHHKKITVILMSIPIIQSYLTKWDMMIQEDKNEHLFYKILINYLRSSIIHTRDFGYVFAEGRKYGRRC